ncbi:MAG: hypothetical protein R2748_05420 [Bryobacterales bacterium]
MPGFIGPSATTTSTRSARPFHGYWSLSLKGTAEKPITIKAAGDGEAIFDGGGNHKLFDVMATEHHIFEKGHLPQHRDRVSGRREGGDGSKEPDHPKLPV